MWHWIPDTEEIIDTFKTWAWLAIATTVGFLLVIYLGLPLVMTSDRLSLSGLPLFWLTLCIVKTMIQSLILE